MHKNLMIIGGITGVVVMVLLGSLLNRTPSTETRPIEKAAVPLTTTNQAGGQLAADTLKTSWYTAYSPESVSQVAADNKKAVIFFHAGWCPTCLAAAKDFQENISQVPADVTILKANYDTETELKKKYSVVMQDTFVQVDAEGNQVAMWNSGGEGIESLLANLR